MVNDPYGTLWSITSKRYFLTRQLCLLTFYARSTHQGGTGCASVIDVFLASSTTFQELQHGIRTSQHDVVDHPTFSYPKSPHLLHGKLQSNPLLIRKSQNHTPEILGSPKTAINTFVGRLLTASCTSLRLFSPPLNSMYKMRSFINSILVSVFACKASSIFSNV